MTTGKTSTLTFRIEPSLKNALRIAAEREHRSIANMIEVLIRDHCNRTRIDISDLDVMKAADRRGRPVNKQSETTESKAKSGASSKRS
jgi:hypothetical protein